MRKDLMTLTALAALLAGCQDGAGEAEAGNAAANEANAAIAAVAEPSAEDRAAIEALLPPYPGAEQARGGTSARGGSLAFRTADAPRRVADFYIAAARRAGFTIDDPGEGVMLISMSASREGGGFVSLTATRVGNVTEVQAMASIGAGG